LKTYNVVFAVLVVVLCVFAQTRESYEGAETSPITNLSGLTVHHSIDFGMVSSSGGAAQSEGIYSTMLTYRFSRPLTLKMNIGLPVFSTFSPYQNLTQQNLMSADYFKNMPFAASLSWKPAENFSFHFSVVHSGYNNFDSYSFPWYSRSDFMINDSD
jgi:hypothetical protein